MSSGSVTIVGSMPDSPSVRTCCLLVESLVGGNNIFDTAIHAVDHKYGGGDLSGIVYTCRAGFVDLGHVRDLIDLTRYYHSWITIKGKKKKGDKFRTARYSGLVYIDKDITTPAEEFAVARSIAYDCALFHEIYSYWVGIPGGIGLITMPGMHNSSFSPEDLPSNHLGTHVGEKALEAMVTAKKTFETAVTDELGVMLGSLGALDLAGTTDALAAARTAGWMGTDYKDSDYLKRRNFDVSPINPWLLPSFAPCPSPTPLGIPKALPAGTDTFYDLILDVPEVLKIPFAMRAAHPSTWLKKKRGDFASCVTDIKSNALAEYGANYDKP
jgi:Protein of unknown function (DUF4056)